MWFKLSQNNPVDWQPEYQFPENYRELVRRYFNLSFLKDRTPEENAEFEELSKIVNKTDKEELEHREKDKSYNQLAEDLISSGKPEQVPQRYFLDYHYTGGISGNPYYRYTDNPEGLNWLNPNKFDIHIKTFERNGKMYELKAEREPSKYVKHKPDGEIARDENNLALYLTDEEAEAKGYPLFNYTVALFNEGKIVGYASDEFGASGVYLQKDYQGQGLGSLLMYEYLKISGKLKKGKKIGQMTSWGTYMTKNLHKLIVEEALKEGKYVPEKILNEYPDLKEKYVV